MGKESMDDPKPKTFSYEKKITISQIIEVVRKEGPIAPHILKAKIVVGEPFISSKRADEFIVDLVLAGELKYEKKDGKDFICLSK